MKNIIIHLFDYNTWILWIFIPRMIR